MDCSSTRVLQAVPGANFTVYAYFSDGTIHLLDAKPLIEKGGVFSALSDEEFFSSRLTVMNDTVAWDVSGTRDAAQCIDLDPWALYQDTPVVSDPLQDVA
ncbi:MAG: DUF2442 domain-containing protein [Eggerthellaceae bacterium]|nr:DUF2442 domain-containing protein [Eggerthellaceae bacterium]